MITKRTKDFDEIDFNRGEVLLIDKNYRSTSFSVVHKVRKYTGVKKVGHAGTLDPRATGLLIICTGKATKTISQYQQECKIYSGKIVIGKSTPSMDTETEPDEIKDFSYVTNEMIEETRKLFLGKIKQVAPMYSAVKHNGKALYKYARKGVDIAREPRDAEIYEFEITEINKPEISFRIKCSKGTYIRVIADDFGKKLGCGAFLLELRREAIGEYKVEDAFNIEEFRMLMEKYSEKKAV